MRAVWTRLFTSGSDRQLLSVKRIALLGFLLGIMMVVKYALGFVPGIEVITFLVIIFALFLPLSDLMLLIVAFNLSIIAMYGVGTWWIAYWLIWPGHALVTRVLMRWTRSRYVFAVWAFLAGFSVLIYYYFSDLVFFGAGFAALNVITALPINLIEGFVTMTLMISLAPKLLRIINQQATGFWPKPLNFTFKPVKRRLISTVLSVLVVLAAIAGIVTLFVFNSFFITWKNREIRAQAIPGQITERQLGQSYGLMSLDQYNQTVAGFKPNEMAVAVIANGQVTKEVTTIYEPTFLIDVLRRLITLEFRSREYPGLGLFLQSFRFKTESNYSAWLHGRSTQMNGNDYYPFLFYNNQLASLGASSLSVQAHDIVELTYDF